MQFSTMSIVNAAVTRTQIVAVKQLAVPLCACSKPKAAALYDIENEGWRQGILYERELF
jgi:hypothetical protein